MDDYGCFGFDSALLASMSLEAERSAHEEALDWDYEEEEKRRMIAEMEAEDAAYEAYITEAYESYMAEAEYVEAEFDEDVAAITGGEPEEIDPEGGWEFAAQWDAQFAR